MEFRPISNFSKSGKFAKDSSESVMLHFDMERVLLNKQYIDINNDGDYFFLGIVLYSPLYTGLYSLIN